MVAMRILEELREAQESNYKTATILLGDTVSLLEDLNGLYEALAASLPAGREPPAGDPAPRGTPVFFLRSTGIADGTVRTKGGGTPMGFSGMRRNHYG